MKIVLTKLLTNDKYNAALKAPKDVLEILNIPEFLIEVPSFSIIMPFVNNEKILKKAIRSIQNQSFKIYEILFIDDKFSNKLSFIIEQFSSVDKRIKLIKNKKKYGLFFSRVIEWHFQKEN